MAGEEPAKLTFAEVKRRIETRLVVQLTVGLALIALAWPWLGNSALLAVSTLLLVLGAGLLGGWAANVIRFLGFAHRGQLSEEFIVIYTWRPVIGGIVGLLVTMLVAGGLFTVAGGTPTDASVMFFGGLAALAGLFSKKATQKMDEIAGVVFARRDEAPEPAPGKTGASASGSPAGTGEAREVPVQ